MAMICAAAHAYEQGLVEARPALALIAQYTDLQLPDSIAPDQSASRRMRRAMGRFINRLVWLRLRCRRPLAEWPARRGSVAGFGQLPPSEVNRLTALRADLLARVDDALTHVYTILSVLRRERQPLNPAEHLASLEACTTEVEEIARTGVPRIPVLHDM